MIPHYEEKFEYLCKHQERVFLRKSKFHGIKNIQEEAFCFSAAELHHRLHNTKMNRDKQPIFIHSLLNLVAINHDYHMKWPSFRKIYFVDAALWERFLMNPIHWKCCIFVQTCKWPEVSKEEYFRGKVGIL